MNTKTKEYLLEVFCEGKWRTVFKGDYAELLMESLNFTRFKIQEVQS